MVKLTRQYLLRHSDALKIYPARRKNETDESFLKRITHLRLQGKYFDDLEPISGCDNTTHIYLQGNLFTSIPNLNNFSKLTYLYMQRNKIAKLKNLEGLQCVRKLYLGYNEITVVEGMETLRLLKELHVENQDLPLGEMLYVDPRSREILAASLEVLNIAGNNLTTLSHIASLRNLQELTLTDNKISSLENLGETLRTWPNLKSINLKNNPVTYRAYKDVVIQNGRCLKYIDGKEVNASTRLFLDGRKQARLGRNKDISNDGDGVKNQAAPRKVVHFQHLAKAHDCLKASSPSEAPLTFQPWKLRRNVNCHGPYNVNFGKSLR